MGFDYRTFTGLGETETTILEGTNKIFHSPRHRGKKSPHRRLNKKYMLVLEGLLWWCGLAGAHNRDRGIMEGPLGVRSNIPRHLVIKLTKIKEKIKY